MSLESPESSTIRNEEFLTWKLKWDLPRTYVTACLIYKHDFFAFFAIFHVQTEFTTFAVSVP